MSKENKKILVIDDHPIMIRLLERRLTSQGFDFIAAQDGNTGFTLAKEELPDLILLDVLLPDVDGKEMAKRFKADPQTKDIPIIFITVTLSKKDDKEEKEMIIDGHAYPAFAKPLYTPKLMSVIRKSLKSNK